MKVRSKEELSDLLDKEISWRIKELSHVKSKVSGSRKSTEKYEVRSAILLLYSHWEGFIKSSSIFYLTYVVAKKIKYKNASICMVGNGFYSNVRDVSKSKKIITTIDLVTKLFNCEEDIVKFEPSKVIDTESNLNFDVLTSIARAIDIDIAKYELKSNLIDEQLLGNRNAIAHGNQLIISKELYLGLHEDILNMMKLYKNDVLNNAVLESFKQ